MARIEIEIAGSLHDQLSESFYLEEHIERPRPADPNLAYFNVARVFGLSIRICADEHPPPHFHVSYPDEDASFDRRLPAVTGYHWSGTI